MIQSKHVTTRRGLLLLVLLLWGAAGHAQLAEFHPLELNANPDPGLEAKVGGATKLTLDRAELQRLYEADAEDLRVTLPLAGGGKWPLHLSKARVLTDDFRLTDHTGRELPYETPRTYRGIVHGRPECWVAASFSRAGLMAVIVTPEGAFNLGPQGASGDTSGRYVLFNERELKVELPHRECHVEEPPHDPRKDFDPDRAMSESLCYVITKLFVCDYQMYLDFNRSTQQVMDYVTGMYNVVAMIYDREHIMTEIARIQVYTEVDPYRGMRTSSEVLDAFRNDNPLRNFPNISLAHLISTERFSRGGRAYLDVLCRSGNALNLRTGFSEIHRTYQELPFYSWTITVVAHEMGHNLGSPHTQSCTWSGGPIDGCVETESANFGPGDCPRPPLPTPPFKGTIMSYCHTVPNIGIDLNLGFGPLPGDLIRDRVNRADCSIRRDCNCFAPRVPAVINTANPSEIRVEWIPAPRAWGYQVRIRPLTPPNSFDTTFFVTSPSILIRGLNPDLNYEIRIRSLCETGDTLSDWSLIYRYPLSSPPPRPTCSGRVNLTASTGIFNDGSAASANYSNNLSCEWLVAPGTGQPVEVRFNRFSTEQNFDFVEIYNGSSISSPRIGRFSGTALPAALVAQSGTALVRFLTDGAVTNTGWEISYRTLGPPPPSSTCAGRVSLTAGTGTFTDGSAPTANYSNNLNCEWLIAPNLNLPVEVRFNRFATEQNYDFVEIYNGSSTNAPLIGQFSGTALPALVIASSGIALVRFRTDGSITSTGWEITYRTTAPPPPPPTCSGRVNLTSNNGTFNDGSAASANYSNDLSCEWLINPGLGQPVEIRFNRFATEQTFDVVEIFNGSSTNAQRIGQFSGTSLPGLVIAQSGTVLVRFRTDGSVTNTGWEISYRTLVPPPPSSTCAGRVSLTAGTGTFTDGSAPSANYSNNLNCEWLIAPNLNLPVEVRFNRFATEQNYDFVEIYNGSSAMAPLIGQFSGTALPALVIASSGIALVRFRTDGSITNTGWEISYRTVAPPPPSSTCFGLQNLTASIGTFTDGSTPSANYSNNLNCEWRINPGLGQPVEIRFNRFATEQGFDVVEIFNGSNSAAPRIGQFSGTNLPGVVVAQSGTAFIRFRTDGSTTNTGWEISYRTLGPPPPTSTCSGRVSLTAGTGTFTDGSAPTANYSNNLNCEWLIAPNLNQPIEIRFNRFATEQNYDFVEIYNGSSVMAPLIGQFSGSSLPAVVVAQSGTALIRFRTDGSITSTGWEISYRTLAPPPPTTTCSGRVNLTASSGTLSDGSAPSANYSNNLNCEWLIAPASGQPIEIRFNRFATERNFDFVEIFNGSSASAFRLAQFSGTTLPGVVVAQSGRAFIRFRTDNSITNTGWEISYRTLGPQPIYSGVACADETTLSEPKGVLTDGSPADLPYGPNARCEWLIRPTDVTESLLLTFDRFETESQGDVLRVYAGDAATGTPILEHSGDRIPEPVVVQGGAALVTFTSNESVEGRGWQLRYGPGPTARPMETALQSAVKLYPNPTTGLLNVEITQPENGTYLIEVFDLLGRQVLAKEVNSDQVPAVLNLEHLQAGSYFCRISLGHEVIGLHKVVLIN